ncbi:MAG: hypothetical protein HZB39_00095 [Planctomycetes bacterium]|nr:hypothetical protein [Planctomycetota bacterium]
MPDWLQSLFDAITHNKTLAASLVGASVAMFVLGLVLANVLVVRMPADWFLREPRARHPHPAVHVAVLVGRNLLGAVLLLLGIAMLIGPGQGLLMILLAVGVLDFPGKRRLELLIVRRRPIHRAIDWLRRRAGKPPLLLPPSAPLTSDGSSRTDGRPRRTRSSSDRSS